MAREGINLSVKVSVYTTDNEPYVIEHTGNYYNTFDDLILFVSDRLRMETTKEMETKGVEFYKGINTIIVPIGEVGTKLVYELV